MMFNKLMGSERAELGSKSIQYLRKLADAIGVDSPTLMGKEELIDEILVVLMGGSPAKKKETRGRPKKEFDVKVFDDAVEDDENHLVVEYDYKVPRGLGVGVFSSGAGDEKSLRDQRNRLYDKYVRFYEQQLKDNEQKIKEAEAQRNIGISFGDDVKNYITADVDELLNDSKYEINYGYVYNENGKKYLLCSGFDITNKIELSGTYIGQDDYLREGDEVHYYFSDENALNILMVNGVYVDEIQDRRHYNDLKIGYPEVRVDTISIVNQLTPIAYGSRNVLFGDYEVAQFAGTKIVKSVAKGDRDVYVYTLGLDMDENVLDVLKKSSDVIYNITSNSNSFQSLMGVNVFAERVKRLAELGNDVFIYIHNYPEIERFMDEFSNSQIVKDIFELGANFKEAGSITTVACFEKCAENDEINNVLTNKICFSGKIEGVDDLGVVVSQCKTLFMDKFLTFKEMEQIEKLKNEWQTMSSMERSKIINRYN